MLTFGMPVYNQEGELGKLSGVVIDPRQRTVQWLIVSRRGFLWDEDSRLIAPKAMTAQTKQGLHLNQTQWDFSVSRRYIRMSDRHVGVPLDMVVLSPRTPVHGVDGLIGRLRGIELDAEHRQLTRLLIKGEWILGREWVVPAAWADELTEEEIHLNRLRREIRNDFSQPTSIAHVSSQA